MALCSDAVMMLFYDIEGNTADHDDWHSHEHFHERLSVPGFLRASRWISKSGKPRYMVIYEVDSVEVATSPAYLDRLNNPTGWTSEIMPRFRGMTRGFCHVVASSGFGLGHAAVVLRFLPEAGAEEQLAGWLAREVMPEAAARRGMVGAYLLQPTAPPPMTHEQELRGPDKAMPWLLILSGYEAAALERELSKHLDHEVLRDKGASEQLGSGSNTLHYMATALEVSKSAPLPEHKIREGDAPR